MARFVNEPITVYINKDSEIAAFIWRRCLYDVVETISSWWEVSDWWDGEPECLMHRVIAKRSNEGTYELCNMGTQWFLCRIID